MYMAENKIIVNSPISVGELMDKISILKIKKKNIADEKKLSFINKELHILLSTLNEAVQDNIINEFLDKLIEVNSKLWKSKMIFDFVKAIKNLISIY